MKTRRFEFDRRRLEWVIIRKREGKFVPQIFVARADRTLYCTDPRKNIISVGERGNAAVRARHQAHQLTL
jgi:hypothetical protein